MNSMVIGIDIAKSSFEVAVSKTPGRVCERKRLSRTKLMEWLGTREASVVVMEACSSAHFLGRSALGMGHEVKLLPPHRIRPYVTGSKTDRTDTKGILEAYRNEEIRAIPVKTPEQQATMGLHRLRQGWMRSRNRRLNSLRGLLREYGKTIPQGARRVVPAVYEAMESLPPRLCGPLQRACEEIRLLEESIREVDQELCRSAKDDPICARLMTIPGVGPMIATTMVAEVHDATRFPSGRHLASYLGLVPREHSSGSVRRLGRITKQGNRQLRTLLVQGAHSLLVAAARSKHPSGLQIWALQLKERIGHNKAAVALANRLTRIIWSVWTQDRTWQPVRKAA